MVVLVHAVSGIVGASSAALGVFVGAVGGGVSGLVGVIGNVFRGSVGMRGGGADLLCGTIGNWFDDGDLDDNRYGNLWRDGRRSGGSRFVGRRGDGHQMTIKFESRQ